MDRMLIAIWIIIIVMVGGLIWAFMTDKSNFDSFMAECVKDRKEYECVAMWRAGRSNTVVMPVVVR